MAIELPRSALLRVLLGLAALMAAAVLSAAVPGQARAVGPTHVVGTYDGSTLRLFVNGRQVAEKKTGVVPATPVAGEIGSFLGGEVWNGVIDDVAVYSRPLSADAVRNHFRLGTGQLRGRYARVVSRSPAAVSYWRLGEKTGTAAADSAGNSPGTYRTGTRLGVRGIIANDPDGAMSLQGTGGGVIIRQLRGLSPRSGFTLEAWVDARDNRNATIVTADGAGFLKTNPSGQWGFGVISGPRIDSTYAREKASNVNAPSPAPTTNATPGSVPAQPAKGKGKGGGIGAGVIVFGVVILAGVLLGLRALFAPGDEEEEEGKEEEGGEGQGARGNLEEELVATARQRGSGARAGGAPRPPRPQVPRPPPPPRQPRDDEEEEED